MIKKIYLAEILRGRVPTEQKVENIKGTALISLYAVLVGLVAGFGAVGFRYMIAFFHNLFFLGTLSFSYHSEEHMASSWGWGVIFVPLVGMMIVNFLIEKYAPEAKGHGVPEVMNAVLEKKGVIRPIVSVIKSLASAISIGSGGSVGREGPIVQIGASFGSTLGQLLKLSPKDVIILVSAGVAGGIAGTFNAPIGGVAFAFELILPEFSIMTLMPLVVSATVSTYLASIFLGTHPAFIIPSYHLVSSVEFIFYILLGVIAGIVAIIYIRTLYKTEDIFDSLKCSPYLKGAAGALVLGITGYLIYRMVGNYYVFGVGYSFITDALSNKPMTMGLVLALIFLKIFANAITLSAGGSGGIFAPSLFIGAGTGSVVGILANHLFPNLTAPVSAYALVGMSAVVAGTTGASFTAIIMTFEMTRNYEIMLPLMLSVVIAHFVTRLFNRDNIYTKKLARRGIYVQTDKMVSIFKMTRVSDAMRKHFIYATEKMQIDDVQTLLIGNNIALIPVIEKGKVEGVVSYIDLYHKRGNQNVMQYVKRGDFTINGREPLLNALEKMERNQCSLLVVLDDDDKIIGITTRNKIIKTYFKKKQSLLV